MQTGDIDELATFVRVVDHKGLSAAAIAMGRPKSSVSRKLASLELRLGARLVDRGARNIRLTETGRIVYDHAVRALAELNLISDAVRPGEARGLLRVTSTFALVDTVLRPILPRFLKHYPAIQLEIEASNRLNDLVRDDFDVALRAGALNGDTLIARRLAAVSIGLFASPDYLLRNGNLDPDSLADDEVIGLVRHLPPSKPKARGAKATDAPAHPRLSMNDPLLIKRMVLDGIGLGWLPLYLCRDEIADGRLIRCLPERTIEGPEIFALYSGRRDLPAKIRVFVDFLATEFGKS